jgi:hypothetical protein
MIPKPLTKPHLNFAHGMTALHCTQFRKDTRHYVNIPDWKLIDLSQTHDLDIKLAINWHQGSSWNI